MTASAATAPKARKTRTRKPRATAAVKTVTKAATPKRPSTAKLINSSRYMQDIKQRWAIHEFEINALASDLKKGFTMVQPYGQQLVDQFKN